MEDSPEHSHWASPTLLSSDALAAFSSEPSLLPPGEESEAFFSGQDADLAALPSFFPSPNHGRAPPAYRHGSGRCSPSSRCPLAASGRRSDFTRLLLHSPSGVELLQHPQ